MIKTKVQLEAENDANITTNGSNDITGAILNALVTNLIDSLEVVIQSYTTAQIAAISSPTLRQIVFDTDTNTFKYYDGTRWVEFAHPKYKVYTALLTQTGTDAPTATVLENTLGGTVVWTRGGAGAYLGTLASAFTSNKTYCIIGTGTNVGTSLMGIYRSTNNAVEIDTFEGQNGATPFSLQVDEQLFNTPIEIRVYY